MNKKRLILFLNISIFFTLQPDSNIWNLNNVKNFQTNIKQEKSSEPDKLKDQNQKIETKLDPLLVITLMVKDEEKVIVDTIKPYVEAGLDSFLIYDTGSTDKTMEVIEKYFKDNKVKNYYIKQEPFIDYSSSRNKALELTEKYFPNAVFTLMPDAEWYIENVDELLEFCKKHKNDDPKNTFCYNIKIDSPGYEFYTSRLIKCGSGARFYQRVHETILQPYSGHVPEPVCFRYSPKEEGIEKSIQRYKRDKKWLLEDHKEDPKNSRIVYYLAQTCFSLEQHDDAIKYYKLYTTLDNSTEYAFQSWYTLGKIFDLQFDKDQDNEKWFEGLTYLLNAYTMRPHRAEPLVRIAQHYLLTKNWPLCFMFARQASDLEYPKEELLFVEKEYYDYDRFNILGIASWFVGQYEIGEDATRKALIAKPFKTHLQENMNLYLARKYKDLYEN